MKVGTRKKSLHVAWVYQNKVHWRNLWLNMRKEGGRERERWGGGARKMTLSAMNFWNSAPKTWRDKINLDRSGPEEAQETKKKTQFE